MLIGLALLGCADTWTHADIQIDIKGASWQRESRIRACIQDQQVQTHALQAGRIAIDYLYGPLELTLQLLPPKDHGDNPSHQVDMSISKLGYYSEEWLSCATMECLPCQVDSLLEQGPLLLAIRLDPEELNE